MEQAKVVPGPSQVHQHAVRAAWVLGLREIRVKRPVDHPSLQAQDWALALATVVRCEERFARESLLIDILYRLTYHRH